MVVQIGSKLSINKLSLLLVNILRPKKGNERILEWYKRVVDNWGGGELKGEKRDLWRGKVCEGSTKEL